MVTWKQFSEEVPALATAVEARFTAHKHHVLATLRKDGSPRVSGTEVEMLDGRLVLGSMFGALKAKDLFRDGRYALHSNPGEHTMEGGDAKIAGIAREVSGEEFETVLASYTYEVPKPLHLFILDITEVVHTTVDDEHMYVDLWKPGKEIARFTK
ncbi:pyridoxamine 5'-phosphate oxidase family protein [Rhodococcus sp. KBS0724]|uniref:pyridoxamine 5'-phosphate oxidase family protein n=1 Tax=Rhodococcus sp. KBS0724 TaxID=1179674 RepID=UPI00163D8DE0|nr:pyridoxamine 5'-phosphate oxidase family protein [Rhodococcus sp. KBS0724]